MRVDWNFTEVKSELRLAKWEVHQLEQVGRKTSQQREAHTHMAKRDKCTPFKETAIMYSMAASWTNKKEQQQKINIGWTSDWPGREGFRTCLLC